MTFRYSKLGAVALIGAVGASVPGTALAISIASRTPTIAEPPSDAFALVRVGAAVDSVDFFSVVPSASRSALAAAADPKCPGAKCIDLVLGGVREDGGPVGAAGIALGGADGATINRLNASANTDPFITTSIAVTDVGAASPFLFTFTIPTVVMTGAQVASATLGITITDAGGDGASIAVDPSFATIMINDVGDAGDPGGSSVCPAGVDIGSGFAAGAFGTAVMAFSAGPVSYAPAAGCDSRLFLTLAFLGSGGGDEIAITARFSVDPAPVPVPSVLALFGAGLVGLGFARRRRA